MNEGATWEAPMTTISSGTSCYQAGTSITATSGLIVNGTANVTFIAGSSITLGPGFDANGTSGAVFTAKNQGLPPTITSFTPASGPIGTLVTVNGSNFGSAPQISMNQLGRGTLNAPPSSAAATTLTFVVPAGAATGPISVANSSGSVTTPTTFA